MLNVGLNPTTDCCDQTRLGKIYTAADPITGPIESGG